MPFSVIFETIDLEGNILLSIGNEAYMKQQMKNCRQIVSILGIEQTEDERKYMTTLNKQELYEALTGFMMGNRMYVFNPN